ncbi:VWA domain-containing protein [Pajaroellobacter abortibovis]|uniref:VWA domain-containing protein n=1 Tax=Pajaroellobacter abortibovis TaxID=1882918 RepID=UPI001FE5BB01|nr:VWA domain-containing protein [Pajaroellobacter abortibovis]
MALLVRDRVVRRCAFHQVGDESLVRTLIWGGVTTRRWIKGTLFLLAMVCMGLAFARPQSSRGTRLIPATNLDVVLALDYSKSMYARDIIPSRIDRAKVEVARLVRQLAGARFAAVAFAGEPMSFPLTSDGAAIVQFLRQLEPNDMPVGGTATARALRRAGELFSRDPQAKDHVRVIVLITDGEDLEGDPVITATALAKEGIRVDVVQIGGKVPEAIPEVNEEGKIIGFRRDEQGKLLTTELSAEGEVRLSKIASLTGGTLVRSEQGGTGIEQITETLSRMMREELSERVEYVFSEEYAWPLGLAIVFLTVEAWIGEAPLRKQRKRSLRSILFSSLWLSLLTGIGCNKWNPAHPFEHNAPLVSKAVDALDGGDASAAALSLEQYLGAGGCAEGNIGITPSMEKRPAAVYDLALAYFLQAEGEGPPFGEEEDGTQSAKDSVAQKRIEKTQCALQLIEKVLLEKGVEPSSDWWLLGQYLKGNLHFLRGRYQKAVEAYEAILKRTPAQEQGVEGGGGPESLEIARRAAWNRAIAIRRVEQAPPSPPPDGDLDGGSSSDRDSGEGGSGQGQAKNQQDQQESPSDAGASSEPSEGGGSVQGAFPDVSSPSGSPSSDQGDRILEQFEHAPTVQQEVAKKRAKARQLRGGIDK